MDGIIGLLTFVWVSVLADLRSSAARLVPAGSIRTVSSPLSRQSPPFDIILLVQTPPFSAIGTLRVLYLLKALHWRRCVDSGAGCCLLIRRQCGRSN
jgi:hypothetical protein